jgi:hypothetical protein
MKARWMAAGRQGECSEWNWASVGEKEQYRRPSRETRSRWRRQTDSVSQEDAVKVVDDEVDFLNVPPHPEFQACRLA